MRIFLVFSLGILISFAASAADIGYEAFTRHTIVGNVNGGKNQLVDVVNLFPTFCESTGTEIPPSLRIDGSSFMPFPWKNLRT